MIVMIWRIRMANEAGGLILLPDDDGERERSGAPFEAFTS